MTLLATLVVQPCFAQRVALIRPPPTEAILTDAYNRLKAELDLQLFQVVVIDACRVPPCPTLFSIAQEQNGRAAISLQISEQNIATELAIIDRASRAPILEHVVLDVNPDAPAVLALRAVDLLRSQLREVPQSPPPQQQLPPPTKPEGRSPAPTTIQTLGIQRMNVRIGLALVEMAPALSTDYGLELTVERRIAERFRVGIQTLGPTAGARFEGVAGTATIRQKWAMLRASLLLASTHRMQLWSGLGLGLYHLDARADTLPDFVSKSGQLYARISALTMNASYRVSERISLESDLSLFTITPRPIVAVAESSTSFRWGLWSAAIGIGMNF